MSVQLRDVKRRIGSTSHIRKVTSALQRVASAKLSHDRRSVAASNRYTEQIIGILRGVLDAGYEIDHPLLSSPTNAPTCAVVYGSDRGLCGGYNSAVMDALMELEQSEGPNNLVLIVCGRIPAKRASRRGLNIIESYPIPGIKDRSEFLDKLMAKISDGFTSGSFGRVKILYTHFISPIDKQAVVRDILPLSLIRLASGEERPVKDTFYSNAILDPTRPELLDALLPEVLRQSLDFTYLHSVCCEDAYRQEAMMRASDNAREMLHDLRLTYSRLRQASITTEMLEIAASGFASQQEQS